MFNTGGLKTSGERGNQSQVSHTITVVDVTAPVMDGSMCRDTVIYCPASPVFTTAPTASDLCDANVPVVALSTDTLLNPDGSTTYTRTWTATDDCGNTSSFLQKITFIGCNGSRIAEDNTSSIERLVAYPNPSSEMVYFKMNFTKDMEKVYLHVFDVTGMKVAELFNSDVISGVDYVTEFNAENVVAGTYFYTLVTPYNSKAGKIAIIK